MPPRQLRLHTLRLSALPFFRSLLVLLVLGAYVAWQSLRANYKVRDGQLLMNILTALNELFISAQAYDQLKKDLEGAKNLDWSKTMNSYHAELHKVMKTYDAIGRLIDGGLVSEE